MLKITTPYDERWPRAARDLGGSWIEYKQDWYFADLAKARAIELALDIHGDTALIVDNIEVKPEPMGAPKKTPPAHYGKSDRVLTVVYMTDHYRDVYMGALQKLIGAMCVGNGWWVIPRSREDDARDLAMDCLGHDDRIVVQTPSPIPGDAITSEDLTTDEIEALARQCIVESDARCGMSAAAVRRTVRTYWVRTRCRPRMPSRVARPVIEAVEKLTSPSWHSLILGDDD